MPYSADWYIENEVLYMLYSGESTLDELRESLLTVKKFIDTSSRPLVHIITDVSKVTIPIAPKNSLPVVRDVGSHDRLGWNVILGETSVMLKIGIALGTSIFKMRTRTLDTIEEAEAFLAEKDSTLNWDQVNRSVLTH